MIRTRFLHYCCRTPVWIHEAHFAMINNSSIMIYLTVFFLYRLDYKNRRPCKSNLTFIITLFSN